MFSAAKLLISFGFGKYLCLDYANILQRAVVLVGGDLLDLFEASRDLAKDGVLTIEVTIMS